MKHKQPPTMQYAKGRHIKNVPPGKIVAHNVDFGGNVNRTHGDDGFRVWFDDPSDKYGVCTCGWRPDLGTHYRSAAWLKLKEQGRPGGVLDD
jgi:hypothetical protein